MLPVTAMSPGGRRKPLAVRGLSSESLTRRLSYAMSKRKVAPVIGSLRRRKTKSGSFACGWENMLLHIFRLEAKASAEAAGEKRIGAARAASLSARRVEDIIGNGPPWRKDAGYAADCTLAA